MAEFDVSQCYLYQIANGIICDEENVLNVTCFHEKEQECKFTLDGEMCGQPLEIISASGLRQTIKSNIESTQCFVLATMSWEPL